MLFVLLYQWCSVTQTSNSDALHWYPKSCWSCHAKIRLANSTASSFYALMLCESKNLHLPKFILLQDLHPLHSSKFCTYSVLIAPTACVTQLQVVRPLANYTIRKLRLITTSRATTPSLGNERWHPSFITYCICLFESPISWEFPFRNAYNERAVYMSIGILRLPATRLLNIKETNRIIKRTSKRPTNTTHH